MDNVVHSLANRQDGRHVKTNRHLVISGCIRLRAAGASRHDGYYINRGQRRP